MAKKEKPRCQNCGDETTFPNNSDMECSKKGWCVPCYRQWCDYGPGRNSGNGEPVGEEVKWKEKSLYGRRPFDSRAIEDK